MILAKKLAEASKGDALGEVLISKEVYERGISELKVERKKIGDIDAYLLKTITDYDKNRKFINDFIKRNEKDKPKGFNSFNNHQSKFIIHSNFI